MPEGLNELDLTLSLRDDPDADAYTNSWAQTLEAVASRPGSALRSLAVFVLVYWPDIDELVREDGPMRRFDAVVGSDALGIINLKWDLMVVAAHWTGSVKVDYSNVHQWVNENLFPKTAARFVEEAGQSKHGTSCVFKQDWI